MPRGRGSAPRQYRRRRHPHAASGGSLATSPLLPAAYVATLLRVMHHPRTTFVRAALGPARRIALTNYLAAALTGLLAQRADAAAQIKEDARAPRSYGLPHHVAAGLAASTVDSTVTLGPLPLSLALPVRCSGKDYVAHLRAECVRINAHRTTEDRPRSPDL